MWQNPARFTGDAKMKRLLIAVITGAACLAAQAQTLTPEQKRFHAIYKELVETNTSHSAGDNTLAARRMAKHLKDAGFADAELQIFEPFPKKGNLVARFKGDGSKKPLLLLAHLDVVEALRNDWKTDPFVLQESDGYFTARGSIDDKSMAAAFVSVLSQLKREGFRPKRDIILALTADEERGDVPSNGVYWLVNNKRELLAAEFGINEGGSGELREGKPSLQRMQVAEKMYTTYQFMVRNPGGHSSLPVPENAIYQLAAALMRVSEHRFPVKLAEVTRAYFERSAKLVSGQAADDMRAVASGEADEAVYNRLSGSAFYNAQLRTTCVATKVQAGHADNALPQSASATINCRILPHDDAAVVDAEVRRLAGPAVEVKALNPPLASPPSPLRPEVMKVVEGLTQEMFPGIPVVPSMSTGATDSRFLRNLGIPVYGVSGLFIDPADYRAHGLDERIEQKSLYAGREFMYQLVKRLAQ
jgi:acetylornithine deacetylase/succinyl-diaminopimelate desuccinylase-like protein